MVHIYNGILLNCKEGWIWVSSSEVDEHELLYRVKYVSKEKNKYDVLHIYGV